MPNRFRVFAPNPFDLRVFLPDGAAGGGDGGTGGAGGTGDKPPEGDKSKPADDKQPDLGGNVDELPEWARKAITKANGEAASYRTKVRELEPLAAEAQKLKDAQLSETERANKAREDAIRERDEAKHEALVLRVAHDKGLTTAQAGRLRGKTKEELEADADDLLAQFGNGKKDNGGGDQLRRKPAERLRPGGGNNDDDGDETDPVKLAAKVPRRY